MMQKKIKFHGFRHTIYMDSTIDPILQNNICLFIYLISKFDNQKEERIHFYFKRGFVYDEKGEGYFSICKEYNGRGISEIRCTTKDFDDLKEELGAGGACDTILRDVGEMYGHCIIWKRYPVLSKNYYMDSILLKVWENKMLEPALRKCLYRAKKLEIPMDSVPKGMNRKEIRNEFCHYIIDMSTLMDKELQKVLCQFLYKISCLERKNQKEIRFSFVNKIIKNKDGETVLGHILTPEKNQDILLPQIRISLLYFNKIKQKYGQEEAYDRILYELALLYMRYCLWRAFPVIMKSELVQDMCLKIWERIGRNRIIGVVNNFKFL